MIGETVHVGANRVQLHVVRAGPETGPLVLLLHGFPEFWFGWRYQIEALAAAGFRVWAPDQRGYNLSEKPGPVSAYDLNALADDVLGLIRCAGRERATVVGHDWGGVVAWHLAIQHPEHVERLAVLNAPHPAAMAQSLRRNVRQLVRSFYALLFQLPHIPEWVLSARDYAGLAWVLKASSREGTFSEAALARYREAWRQPGALRGMLNWYRAAFRHLSGTEPEKTKTAVRAPTMILWGGRDQALLPELAEKSLIYCENGRLVTFPEISHWIQHESPERVNERLISFFGERSDP